VTLPLAHGLVGKQDLPIPEWLFGWAAAVVLIVSFVALATLWPAPRLETPRRRRLPVPLGRAVTSPVLEVVLGAASVGLLVLVVYAGLAGSQSASRNLAPTFVYVFFWLGLVPASVMLGDVFRLLNPWRALGKGAGWLFGRFAGDEPAQPLEYPERIGRWPAVLGLSAFAWLELASRSGNEPRSIAIAALVYTGATLIAMSLYGVDRWLERGEAFSVYFNLYARISPWERDGREVFLRPPLSGLPSLPSAAGTVALLAVMIGSVSFDGLAEGALWGDASAELVPFFSDLGLSAAAALEASSTIGLTLAVLLVAAFYRLGVAGAKTGGGGHDSRSLARGFAHTLVPIALVYAAAHYFTLLIYQGQAIDFLAADPLGNDPEADRSIDFGVIGANAVWYWQVGFVVSGHAAALALAHDRALVLYEKSKLAARSQYWMLAVMVGFTTLALWLLSEANG